MIDEELNLKSSMIRVAIKRNGTAYGFYWSDNFLGEQIEPKIKSQMSSKYIKVEQLNQEGGVVNTFKSIIEAVNTLKYSRASTGHIVNASKTGKLHKGYKWKVYE
jgi:hypothetical protein